MIKIKRKKHSIGSAMLNEPHNDSLNKINYMVQSRICQEGG